MHLLPDDRFGHDFFPAHAENFNFYIAVKLVAFLHQGKVPGGGVRVDGKVSLVEA